MDHGWTRRSVAPVALALLGAALLLAGCGKRQAVPVADGQGGSPELTTTGVRGASRFGLTDPPAERAPLETEDIEKVIQLGELQDTRERPDPGARDDAEHEDDHAEPDAEDTALDAPDKPDTSEDSRWQTINNPVVAVETNKGVFYLELWPDVAPKHVESMLKLAKGHFYDGIYIHRVEPGFVMQTGDPSTKGVGVHPGAGSGGPGYTLPAEFSNKPHLRGTLSMARTSDPNSAGSQFFVVLERAPHLDNQYTVFGQVLGDGMDVVDELEVGDVMWFVRVVKE